MDDRGRTLRPQLLARVLAPAMIVALVVVPSTTSRADAPPAQPTAVQVSWTTLGPVADEMQPAVLVSWHGTDPVASYAWHTEVWTGRAWSVQQPMGTTAAGVVEDAEFAWRFPYRSTVRVAVHAVIGGASGPDAYSPTFDTQGPLPLLRAVTPHADGRVTVTWTPRPPGPDTTPGDPLDLTAPYRYQIVQYAAIGEAFLDIGPSTTALSGTVVPGSPGLLGVAPETEWTAGTGVDFVDFSQPVDRVVLAGTVVTAKIPRRTAYGRTVIARGTVTRVTGAAAISSASVSASRRQDAESCSRRAEDRPDGGASWTGRDPAHAGASGSPAAAPARASTGSSCAASRGRAAAAEARPQAPPPDRSSAPPSPVSSRRASHGARCLAVAWPSRCCRSRLPPASWHGCSARPPPDGWTPDVLACVTAAGPWR